MRLRRFIQTFLSKNPDAKPRAGIFYFRSARYFPPSAVITP